MDPNIDPSITPGMQPPDGHIPQFDAPYNSLQIGSVVAFGVTYFIATLFLSLRIFQVFKLNRKFELDLSIIIIAYGVSLFYIITLIRLQAVGWGKHLYDVNLLDLIEFNEQLLPNTLAYLMCPSITKLGIAAVLFRINPSKVYRFMFAAVAAAIFSYTFTLCVITGVPCNPNLEGSLQCLQNVALSHAVLNIASDIAVIVIPIPTIHRLNQTFKQRAAIGCLITLGSAVVVCSIARLPYVIVLPNTEDATYYQAILGIWSIIEINLGIVCASAMRLKPFFETYMPQLGLYWSSSRSQTSSVPWKQRGPTVQPNGSQSHSYQLHSVGKNDHDHQLATSNGSTDEIIRS